MGRGGVTGTKYVAAAGGAIFAALLVGLTSSAGSPLVDSSSVAGAPDRPAPQRPSFYYVSPHGNDRAGVGTRSRPWRTLAKACASTPGRAGHTIRLLAGVYDETVTCGLPCATSLRGAGAASTTVRGTADPLVSLRNCMGQGNRQTISRLLLDGQDRQAGVFGLRVFRVRGLTVERLVAQGFRGPQDAGGGAVDIHGAWNLDLGHSTLRNSGNANANTCSGTLALGEIHDSRVHDLAISDDQAYGIKASTQGVARRSSMSNVDFSNLDVRVLSDTCARWTTLAFELFRVDAVNVTIRNSRFNRVLSLISDGGALKRNYRYRVHHNLFTIPSGHYALELNAHSSVVDHNYFDGGFYAVAAFARSSRSDNTIHHNVFDNQTGPTAAMHMTGGMRNAGFYNNTIVLRQPSWRDGVFSLGEAVGYAGGTSRIRNNLFVSTHPIGDKLGLGLGSSLIDRNGFFNIAVRGTNPVTADPRLPLAGAFPRAYIPPRGSPTIDAGVVIRGITDGHSGAAPDLGAFDRGTWSVGPR